MPARWRKRFKPEIPLGRIATVRTRGPEGKGASFSGWDLHQSLPLLHSMIEFPPAAKGLDHERLIWKAVANDPGNLTRASFLEELNRQISNELATREETFHVLTSISIDRTVVLKPMDIERVRLRFYTGAYPKKFRADRQMRLDHPRAEVKEAPDRYVRVVATVIARSPSAAFTAASRAIDLYRAAWCFLGNAQMEISGRSWMPINVVRLGPAHTVHRPSGKCALEDFWFEPHQVSADAYRPDKPTIVEENARRILKLIKLKSPAYSDALLESLLMHVRALDEWNQSTALIRLWTALERLCSPDFAAYEDVVRRCAFLWDDVDFAAQTLEHLREVRNATVHRGADSKEAKTYCFQLQQQYRALIRFHLGRAARLASLQEANEFLDLPPDLDLLKRRADATRRAMRFRNPRPAPTA